jgi:hypothetical protein
MKQDELFLVINDDEISRLTPIMKNLLVNNDFGTFDFERDGNDTVINFKLSAGRVTNLLFTKE